MGVGVGILELLISMVLFGSGLLAALIAWKKGYSPWYWLFSMGPVGLVVIAATPSLDSAKTPELREIWETKARWVGGVMSGLVVIPMVSVAMLGFLLFFSLRSTAVPPARVAVPIVAPVIEEVEREMPAE